MFDPIKEKSATLLQLHEPQGEGLQAGKSVVQPFSGNLKNVN